MPSAGWQGVFSLWTLSFIASPESELPLLHFFLASVVSFPVVVLSFSFQILETSCDWLVSSAAKQRVSSAQLLLHVGQMIFGVYARSSILPDSIKLSGPSPFESDLLPVAFRCISGVGISIRTKVCAVCEPSFLCSIRCVVRMADLI